MPQIVYFSVELNLLSRDRARLLCPDQEDYDDAVHHDDDLCQRLLELEHSKDYQSYGRTLFEATFPVGGRLHRGLYSALDGSRKEGKRLRLRLHIASRIPSEVHALHWELLSDGRDFEIGRSPDTVLSRYISLPFAVSPAPIKPRLLCAIAAPVDAHHYKMAPIDYDFTSRQLKGCFEELAASLQINYLDRPVTPERLREALQMGSYHLLHIHGHGTLPRRGEAALVLEGDDHKVNFTPESVLGSVLLGLRDLKLVTLVACHGGTPSSTGDQLSGLAGSLVKQGIPAVVAMRRAITVTAGISFTRYLYHQLAQVPCIDAAVNEARHRLFIGNPLGVEWSSAVLYMRLTDGLLWLPAEIIAQPQRRPLSPRLVLLIFLLLLTLVSSLSELYVDRLMEPLNLVSYDFAKVKPPEGSEKKEASGSESRVPPQSSPPTARSVRSQPQISLEPIQTGKIGIGALSQGTLAWSGDVARVLSQQLREHRPDLTPVVVPEALRPRLAALIEGDFSTLPGDGRSPYGFEYILLAIQDFGPHPGAIDSFPTINASCEMLYLATRQPQVISDKTYSHSGKASSESGALAQAFGRCLQSSISELPQ